MTGRDRFLVRQELDHSGHGPSVAPKDGPDWKTSLKLWVDILQGIFTIGAILGAGFWFLKQESLKPQVKLEQTITQRPLAGKPGFWLVAVDVRATNIGKVKVSLNEGGMFLKQINPIPGEDLKNVPLKALLLDPGEGDQAAFVTFVVPDYIHTIQVASNYGVPGSKGYSWELLSAADIGDGRPDKTSASSPP